MGESEDNKNNINKWTGRIIMMILKRFGRLYLVRLLCSIFSLLIFLNAICSSSSFEECLTSGIESSNECNYERAIEELEKAIELDENDPRAYLALTIVYVNLKEFERALDYAHKTVSIDSSQALAYYLMGMIFEGLKRFDNAIDAWKVYLSLEPEGDKAETAKKHLQKLTEEAQSR